MILNKNQILPCVYSMAQMSAIMASFLPGILLTELGKDNAISLRSLIYRSTVLSGAILSRR